MITINGFPCIVDAVDACNACSGTDVVVTKAVAYVAASGDDRSAVKAAELSATSSELTVDACNACSGTDVVVTEVVAYVAASDDVRSAVKAAELSVVPSEPAVGPCADSTVSHAVCVVGRQPFQVGCNLGESVDVNISVPAWSITNLLSAWLTSIDVLTLK